MAHETRSSRGPASATGGPQALPLAPATALAMLSSCHERIARECAALRALARQRAGPGATVDASARAAAARLLRFFDTTVARHHAHEEQLLFPALLEAMAGSDAVCLRELTRGLADEHRGLDAAWRRLRGTLVRIAAGEPAPLALDAVDALATLYRQHIECEDNELLPMAARLVADDELLRIGRAMREGRDTG